MKNDLALIYPPLNNYYLDDLNKTNVNNKKYIEINLYNKTDKKISYNINCSQANVFLIENQASQINPYQNQLIKIILNNNENIKFKKFEFIFLFHEFNSDYKNNKLTQKNFINIYLIEKKEDKNIEKNYNNRYFKFKEELNKINENIKNIIKNEKNFDKKRKINLREIFVLIIIIFFLGIIFGIKLSKIWKKLFGKNIINVNNNIEIINENEEEFEEVEFMTLDENEELININRQNMEKMNILQNFNFKDEIKKSREIKEFEKIKNNSSFSNFIRFNLFYIIFFLIFYF